MKFYLVTGSKEVYGEISFYSLTDGQEKKLKRTASGTWSQPHVPEISNLP